MVDTRQPSDKFPDETMPTIFADGVLNLSPSPQIARFFLSRVDPHFTNRDLYQIMPCAQVIMPMAGFVHTAVFFEKALRDLVAKGVITAEQVETARKGQP